MSSSQYPARVKIGDVRRTPVPPEFVSEPTATQPQISYICDLLDKRNLFAWSQWFDAVNAMDREEYAEHLAWYKETKVPEMTKKRASDLITHLRSLPYVPREEQVRVRAQDEELQTPVEPTRGTIHQSTKRIYVEYIDLETDKGMKKVGRIVLPSGDKVLAGSYGLDTSEESQFKNQTSFFKVWVGDRGGWDVRLYVSDDTNRVQIAFGTKLWALEQIVKDTAAARKLFGLEFGKCSNCGRGLTNDKSREDALIDGLGPICRANVGL